MFAAAALSAALAVSPALAARICNNIIIKSPKPGAEVSFGLPPIFRWSSEPEGTTSRSITVSGDQSFVVVSEGRWQEHIRQELPLGDYSWSLTFTDKDGIVICTTPSIPFSVVPSKGHSPIVDIKGTDTSAPQQPKPVIVQTSAGPAQLYIDANGRYVIVLQNSPYAGPYSLLVSSDNYDGTGVQLGNGIIGLVIHGNNNPNNINGSAGPDIIYAYGGADTVGSSGGGDEIHLGTSTPGVGTAQHNQSLNGSKDTVTYQGNVSVTYSPNEGDTVNFGP